MYKITPIILSVACGYSMPAQADIYKFVSKDGVIHLTDKPASKKYVRIIRTPAIITTVKINQRAHTFGHRHKFSSLVNSTAQKYSLDPKLLHAVIQTESAYNHTAVSSKGAVGLMQLMPQTAIRFGVNNRADPEQNITGGARYLKYLLKLFEPNLKLAIAAYNAGENAVLKYGNIPPYPETHQYVDRVLALYRN